VPDAGPTPSRWSIWGRTCISPTPSSTTGPSAWRRRCRGTSPWRPFHEAALTPTAAFGREEITAHCLANLAKYKVPTSVEIIDVLARNAGGKVLKRELRARFPSP
jgi:acyl-CoA synthetase (AMP-forming)/AMP-acid ligase II